MLGEPTLEISRVADVPLVIGFAFNEVYIVHSDLIYIVNETSGSRSRVKALHAHAARKAFGIHIL